MRKLESLFSLAALGLFATGQSVAFEITTQMLETGQTIYNHTCSVCHGDSGDGKTWATRALNPSPADIASEEMKQHLNMQMLYEHISEGCDGTAMQPFKYQLYEDERNAVAAHIMVNLLGAKLEDLSEHHHDDSGHDHGSDDHGSDHAAHEEGECKPWRLDDQRTVSVKKGNRP